MSGGSNQTIAIGTFSPLRKRAAKCLTRIFVPFGIFLFDSVPIGT